MPAYARLVVRVPTSDPCAKPRPEGHVPGHDAAGSVAPAEHAQTLPAAPSLSLVRLVKRWNVSAEQLLGPLGLTEELLEEPHARLPERTVRTLVQRAKEVTGEPGLGFFLGLEKRATSYGYLGFAVMSAANLGEVLQLTVRYAPALTDLLRLRLQVEGAVVSLVIDAGTDRWRGEDVALIGLVVGFWQVWSALAGREVQGQTDLVISEPSYYPRFERLLPRARFSQPVTRLMLDVSLLDLPIVTADRAGLRLAQKQCEAALEAAVCDSRLVERVRALVARAGEVPPSINELAAALRLSPRTVRRRLAAQGVSFSELLADARREAATLLLSTSPLSVDQIAQRLGYSTAPNFTRAFRRWTGTTPLAYRRTST